MVMWLHALSRSFSISQASRLSSQPIKRPLSGLTSPRISQLLRRLQAKGLRRLKGTARIVPEKKTGGKKFKYPERLLIYHAGTGRIVFIGCLKVTTIAIFAFFTFVAAPAHFQSSDEPKWVAAAVLICGLIPLLFVSYTTSPFVAFIHLRLPTYVRISPQHLRRFTTTLPPTTEIDLTTMNLIGRQRISRVPISELYPKKSRFGIGNFARDIKGKDSFKRMGLGVREGNKATGEAKRPWWMPKPPMVFGVGRERGSGIVREEGVWKVVVGMIEKGKVISNPAPVKKAEPVARKSKWD